MSVPSGTVTAALAARSPRVVGTLAMENEPSAAVKPVRPAVVSTAAPAVPLPLASVARPTMVVFWDAELNGMITNDKFCCTRWGKLKLSWWRRPVRLRQELDHGDMSEG